MPTYTSLNFLEFFAAFPSEEACEQHLMHVRWPHGMSCHRCSKKAFYKRINTRRAYQCRHCKAFAYPTAGTIFHRTRTPLKAWFLAIFCVAFDKRGVSALQLADQIGVDYNTAWAMLHRIRRAMATRDAQYHLPSPVEMDDTLIGAPTVGGKRGRGTDKTPVLVAISFVLNPAAKEEYTGFAKMQVVASPGRESIREFARQCVTPGSHVRTDANFPYRVLTESGFVHQPIDVKNSGRKAHVLLPHVHTCISNLKTFIQGTYHGLDDGHLQHYLDEYCYRFNRRKHRPELFDRVLLACLEMPETPFYSLRKATSALTQ
ncbi:MAG: IS1595 family transposase [Candidatus Peribacteraceae bacterium]|nr:IS1595 family transposase [Candidatus Peribacteraceae bacterium]